MGHKYLEKIVNIENTPYGWNPTDKRQEMWKQQREQYGFDERETWSLDSTFIYWLYERLLMFKKYNKLETTNEFEINGEKLTFDQCINKMIENCEKYIKDNTLSAESVKLADETLEIFKKCFHSLWW